MVQTQKHGGEKWGTYTGSFPYIVDAKGKLLGRNVKIMVTANSGELCTYLNNKKVLDEFYRRESAVNPNIFLENRDIKDFKNVLVLVEKITKGTEEAEFKRAIKNLTKGGASLKYDSSV